MGGGYSAVPVLYTRTVATSVCGVDRATWGFLRGRAALAHGTGIGGTAGGFLGNAPGRGSQTIGGSLPVLRLDEVCEGCEPCEARPSQGESQVNHHVLYRAAKAWKRLYHFLCISCSNLNKSHNHNDDDDDDDNNTDDDDDYDCDDDGDGDDIINIEGRLSTGIMSCYLFPVIIFFSVLFISNCCIHMLIPHLQKILASDWLFSSVFF